MLHLTRWSPASYTVPGTSDVLEYEVKRLTYLERVEFNRILAPAVDRALKDKGKLDSLKRSMDRPDRTPEDYEAASAQIAEIVGTMFQMYPGQWVEDLFSKWVRNVKGLEVDGKVETDGAALLLVADVSMVQTVIGQIQRLSNLSAQEGKASASPSISTSASRIDAGGSPVAPAANASGTSGETAPETRQEQRSFSGAGEASAGSPESS